MEALITSQFLNSARLQNQHHIDVSGTPPPFVTATNGHRAPESEHYPSLASSNFGDGVTTFRVIRSH